MCPLTIPNHPFVWQIAENKAKRELSSMSETERHLNSKLMKQAGLSNLSGSMSLPLEAPVRSVGVHGMQF
jgi:hypothetical protein